MSEYEDRKDAEDFMDSLIKASPTVWIRYTSGPVANPDVRPDPFQHLDEDEQKHRHAVAKAIARTITDYCRSHPGCTARAVNAAFRALDVRPKRPE